MKPKSVLDALPPAVRSLARRRVQPAWMNPMLATLTRDVFSSPDWIFETKLDGIRCLAYRKGTRLDLYSRNRLRLNPSYPELIQPLLKQRVESFILDGEIVALERGVSRFTKLQRRRISPVPVFYYVFDILFVNGHDVTRLPLRERKALLQRALSYGDPLRLSEHREKYGEKFYKEACGKGWEGLIAKRADSPYTGRRSPDWLKFKCENQQELVIVGYTDPEGQREGIGALLVGVYEGKKLVFAGKVGTGFDTATLRELRRKLSTIERATPPVVEAKPSRAGVHWVQPRLVAQVAFTEWTNDGKLRHPRFLGLRGDKKPAEVVREG